MIPYYDDGNGIVIFNSDCRDVLPTLGSVDLVLTDPPYGIGDKWQGRQINGPNGQSRLWRKGDDWDFSPVPAALMKLVISKGTHAIVFGGNYYALAPSPQWLIWDKCQSFSGSDAELAWTNLDGVVRVFRMSRADAYINKAITQKSHPTEKPVALMRWCIQQVEHADRILDPFMGSGTTLRAAKDLGRRAIGIEIEERYCEIAARRLSQEVFDFSETP